jgi:SAM-dependent methyltransferase
MQRVSQIANRFDQHARNYDNPLTAWLGKRELRAVCKLVPENSQVLDYGCGTGRTTLELMRRGCQVTAFDISSEMLRRAQGKAMLSGFDADFLDDAGFLAGCAWSVITCIGVLDYYPDPVPLLQTFMQYLAPGGRLVVTFPNAISPMGWVYFLESRFTVPAVPRTPRFVKRACQQAGYRVDDILFTLPSVPWIGYTMVLKLSLP